MVDPSSATACTKRTDCPPIVRDAAQADAANATTTFLCRDNDYGLVLVSRPRFPSSGPPTKSRRSRSRPEARGQGGPSPGAAYAARSRPSRSCPGLAPSEAQRADAVLLAGDEPHRQKPHPQRLARVLQHSSGRQRYLPISAQQRSRLRDIAHSRLLSRSGDRQSHPASAAARYTHDTPFRCQTTRRTPERPRVINPSHEMSRAFHPPMLSLASTCVKGIPNFGHWEGDLMQFRTQRGNLLTLCERKTRFTFTAPLPSKRPRPPMTPSERSSAHCRTRPPIGHLRQRQRIRPP